MDRRVNVHACCSGLLRFDTFDVLGYAVHPFAIVGRVFHRDVYTLIVSRI